MDEFGNPIVNETVQISARYDDGTSDRFYCKSGEDGRFSQTGVCRAARAVFVVFGDATNGGETYGGGRFLEAVLAPDGSTVVLDFNRAYNPPCAFTPYSTCPLPVPENQLPFAVSAGEKKWNG